MLARAISGLREDLIPRRKFEWAVYSVVAAIIATLAVLALFGFEWATVGFCAVSGSIVAGLITFGAAKAVRRKWIVVVAVAVLVVRVDGSAGAHRSHARSKGGHPPSSPRVVFSTTLPREHWAHR